MDAKIDAKTVSIVRRACCWPPVGVDPLVSFTLILTDTHIETQKNTVVMGKQRTSIYQQVIERTKALSFRTSLLASNVESREKELAAIRSGTSGIAGGSSNKGPQQLAVTAGGDE